jgi:hypothetical protein
MAKKEEGKDIICRDCGSKFFFSNDEAKFFIDKGLQEPKRCPRCRYVAKIARKEAINVLKHYGILTFVNGATEDTEEIETEKLEIEEA